MSDSESREAIRKKVEELGPWFHQIDLGNGLMTRSIAPSPGPQPVDHPLQRWEKIMNELPADLSGMRILDLGSSDGFFSIFLPHPASGVCFLERRGIRP